MFNSEKTIVLTLDSVINQTYREEVEIIIVNDGSTDKSRQIVEDYLKKNRPENVSINLINRKNSGVSSARNIGIKKARGKWIALLDSKRVKRI